MMKVHHFKHATTKKKNYMLLCEKNEVEFELYKGPIYIATTIIQGGILVPHWKKIKFMFKIFMLPTKYKHSNNFSYL